jgi:hypothetical protein
MHVTLNMKEWKVVEKDGAKVIAGEFEVKAGATVVSKTEFNDGYNAIKVAFPTDLTLEAEKLGEKIAAHITKHFTGKKEE